jgi:hypothetical protein
MGLSLFTDVGKADLEDAGMAKFKLWVSIVLSYFER